MGRASVPLLQVKLCTPGKNVAHSGESLTSLKKKKGKLKAIVMLCGLSLLATELPLKMTLLISVSEPVNFKYPCMAIINIK